MTIIVKKSLVKHKISQKKKVRKLTVNVKIA